MKSAHVSDQAKKEMTRERDRILRKKRRAPSALEKAALAGKKKKEAEERKKQQERLPRETEGSFVFQKFFAQHVAPYDKKDLFEEIGWSQYKPRQKEEGKKEPRSLNMATVRAIAKRLIAREWARVLGKTRSSKFDGLEREAASWKRGNEKAKRP